MTIQSSRQTEDSTSGSVSGGAVSGGAVSGGAVSGGAVSGGAVSTGAVSEHLGTVVWIGDGAPVDELKERAVALLVASPSAPVALVLALAPDLIVLGHGSADRWSEVVDELRSAPALGCIPVAVVDEGTREARAVGRFGLVARWPAKATPSALAGEVEALLRSRDAPVEHETVSGGAELHEAWLGGLAGRGVAAFVVGPDGEAALLTGDGACVPGIGVLLGERSEADLRLVEIPAARALRTDGAEGGSLEGARVAVVTVDPQRSEAWREALADAGAKVQVVTGDEASRAKADKLVPSVVLFSKEALLAGSAWRVWEDERLHGASFVVLGDEATETVVAVAADAYAAERATAERLRAGEGLRSRLEAFGAARWLKVLGGVETPITFEVRAPAGRVVIELANKKIKRARFEPVDGEPVQAKKALGALLGLRVGRVAVGSKEQVSALRDELPPEAVADPSAEPKKTERASAPPEAEPEALPQKASLRSKVKTLRPPAIEQTSAPAGLRLQLASANNAGETQAEEVAEPDAPAEEAKADEPEAPREEAKADGPDAPVEEAKADEPEAPREEAKAKRGGSRSRKSARTAGPDYMRMAKVETREPRSRKKRRKQRGESQPEKKDVRDKATEEAPQSTGPAPALPLVAPKRGYLIAAIIAALCLIAYLAFSGSDDTDAPEERSTTQPTDTALREEIEEEEAPPESDPEADSAPILAPEAENENEAQPELEPEPEPEPEAEPEPEPEAETETEAETEATGSPDPGNLIAESRLAQEEGDRERAAALARLAVQRAPDHAGARFQLALSIRRLGGMDDDALAEAMRAVELAPRNGRFLMFIGDLHARHGRTASALRYFERCVRVQPRMTQCSRRAARHRNR